MSPIAKYETLHPVIVVNKATIDGFVDSANKAFMFGDSDSELTELEESSEEEKETQTPSLPCLVIRIPPLHPSLKRPRSPDPETSAPAQSLAPVLHPGILPPPPPRKKGKDSNSKMKRKKQRTEKLIKSGHNVSSKIRVKFVTTSNVISADLQTQSLTSTGSLYEGKSTFRSPVDPSLPCLLLKDLCSDYTLITWDGITPRPLLDSEGRVVAVLAGRPNKQDFVDTCTRLYIAMKTLSAKIHFQDSDVNHRRGNYPAISVGITPGQGSKHPTFQMPKEYKNLMETLLANADFHDAADYHSYLLRLWCPDMYDRFRACLQELLDNKKIGPKLKRITRVGVYPRVCFNFGPKVFTKHHRDSRNYPAGWCAVQALGFFDPALGGHLVLDDLRLFIQFPPGSIILIPSAAFMHANLPIQPHEERASITQYFPGGLLRFVDHDFTTQKDLKLGSLAQRAKYAQVRKEVEEKDGSWFKTIFELVEYDTQLAS